MSAKAKGSYAELRVQHQLEAIGYSVSKSGGSLGLFDLVAVDKDSVRFIQVKYGTSRLKRVEREAIKALRVPKGVTKEYWLIKKYKKPIIEIL